MPFSGDSHLFTSDTEARQVRSLPGWANMLNQHAQADQSPDRAGILAAVEAYVRLLETAAAKARRLLTETRANQTP